MAPRSSPAHCEVRVAHQQAPVVPNTKGLPALPIELLLEIVSYFPSVPIPTSIFFHCSQLCLERIEVLQALSQMCRSLRSVFLPLMWQRIEVGVTSYIYSDDMRRPGYLPWKKDVATELVRQLEIVTIRDPTLAAYVKIVSVVLTDYCSKAVFREFVRCLALFPNLHTMQILGAGGSLGRDLTAAFAGRTFPTVRTLIVQSFASAILKACPHVKSVTSASGPNPLMFYDIARYCPDVEELRGFSHIEDESQFQGNFFQTMRKHFPKTRVIVLYGPKILSNRTRQELAQFPALQRIEIVVHSYEWKPPIKTFLKQAEEVLRDLDALFEKLPSNLHTWRIPENSTEAEEKIWRDLHEVFRDAVLVMLFRPKRQMMQDMLGDSVDSTTLFVMRDVSVSTSSDKFPSESALASCSARASENPVGDIVDMLMQVLEGLALIHSNNVAHRDAFRDNFVVQWHPESLRPMKISPSRPRVYLIDFEVAIDFPPECPADECVCTGYPIGRSFGDLEAYTRPHAPELGNHTVSSN
ncbi:hypothetical protein Hypma_008938 [Hypsizygus marmoreus]|uniref:Protein kinase domain-containing protein n=1 Tax=Hypsizygus marmoreus TaxID=39966 RepID=A0A369JUP9_HYPMA|nr:hypothetical protein Hypma_008938 [Hypsizygus marmoreus]